MFDRVLNTPLRNACLKLEIKALTGMLLVLQRQMSTHSSGYLGL